MRGRPLTQRHLDVIRWRAVQAISAQLPEDEPDTIPNWCYDTIIAVTLGASVDEIRRLQRAQLKNGVAMRAATEPVWSGLTLFYRGRKATIQRSHGAWLAIAFDKRGNLSSGEYFQYGMIGALSAAKKWCEDRLAGKARKRKAS